MTTELMSQLFNRVSQHLLAQGCKSEDGDSCMYRTPDGLTCAVGCLIPDHRYDEDLEGQVAGDDDVVHAIPELDDCTTRERTAIVDMLAALQFVHDGYPVSDWERELKSVADNFGI